MRHVRPVRRRQVPCLHPPTS
ncbi:unnamed protein product [Ectocarpus sp. CCAP 1310/34]|nr:unnamed protein product [Ectocarpus sp. CCAP 1310/34]